MTTYTPVPYIHREIVEEAIEKRTRGKIFYYDSNDQVDSTEGSIKEMTEISGGLFIILDNEHQIRIDTIITLFGKPGAAFDSYDAKGNVCFDCTGGYPI